MKLDLIIRAFSGIVHRFLPFVFSSSPHSPITLHSVNFFVGELPLLPQCRCILRLFGFFIVCFGYLLSLIRFLSGFTFWILIFRTGVTLDARDLARLHYDIPVPDSWYSSNSQTLEAELDGWLRECGLPKSPDVRGVIAPHAGYSYSGRAAAFAFGNIDPTNITRIFLLGPSHHHYTPKCALSRATIYKTPIGDLPIDLEVIEELKATGKFDMMDIEVDEAEHSMEMHLPYLAKVFRGHSVKVVPIMVGAVSTESEAMYGRLLAKYIDDPKNFFSVSSDFCHWGSRFNYMHYDKKHGAIHKSIEALDKMGMEIIETGDLDEFKRYLLETDNTICGPHPISVFLHVDKLGKDSLVNCAKTSMSSKLLATNDDFFANLRLSLCMTCESHAP